MSTHRFKYHDKNYSCQTFINFKDTQVEEVNDRDISCQVYGKELVTSTKNQKALSKWRKVTNTIKFINVSKNCIVNQKPSTINRAKKHSKWTIVRIAFSAVNFLLRKSKKEQLNKKVRVQCNLINAMFPSAPLFNFLINFL